MNFKLNSLIGLFTTTTFALDPITFKGNLVAESTVAKDGTSLYKTPTGIQQSGAQFPYQKNIQTSVSLGEVYLVGSGGDPVLLQSKFDIIAQECSCYWIDAKELDKRFPSLTTGTYRFQIKGDGYSVNSGTFTLELGAKNDTSLLKNEENDKLKNSSSSELDSGSTSLVNNTTLKSNETKTNKTSNQSQVNSTSNGSPINGNTFSLALPLLAIVIAFIN